jgi:hypothetical protein
MERGSLQSQQHGQRGPGNQNPTRTFAPTIVRGLQQPALPDNESHHLRRRRTEHSLSHKHIGSEGHDALCSFLDRIGPPSNEDATWQEVTSQQRPRPPPNPKFAVGASRSWESGEQRCQTGEGSDSNEGLLMPLMSFVAASPPLFLTSGGPGFSGFWFDGSPRALTRNRTPAAGTHCCDDADECMKAPCDIMNCAVVQECAQRLASKKKIFRRSRRSNREIKSSSRAFGLGFLAIIANPTSTAPTFHLSS